MAEILDTLTAIRQRYACRAYADRQIPPETLRTIAQAGLAAPSALNRQPWRLIVISRPDIIAQLEEAGLAELKLADPAGYERIMGRGGRILYNCQALIFVAQEKIDSPFPASLDVGIVASHLALAARALGVDSVIAALPGLAFQGPAGPALRQAIGWPDGFDFGLSVLLGYAADQPRPPHEPDPTKLIEVV